MRVGCYLIFSSIFICIFAMYAEIQGSCSYPKKSPLESRALFRESRALFRESRALFRARRKALYFCIYTENEPYSATYIFVVYTYIFRHICRKESAVRRALYFCIYNENKWECVWKYRALWMSVRLRQSGESDVCAYWIKMSLEIYEYIYEYVWICMKI